MQTKNFIKCSMAAVISVALYGTAFAVLVPGGLLDGKQSSSKTTVCGTGGQWNVKTASCNYSTTVVGGSSHAGTVSAKSHIQPDSNLSGGPDGGASSGVANGATTGAQNCKNLGGTWKNSQCSFPNDKYAGWGMTESPVAAVNKSST
jgi:hypothetical protein